MDLKLTDKRALVSGSSKGIGFAIATALRGRGHKLPLTAGRKRPYRRPCPRFERWYPARQSRDSSATWRRLKQQSCLARGFRRWISW